jgi:DNA-binding CsgD family transcriptional regulator
MSVIENVGMFLYTLALGASNKEVQERFQHSGETVN